MAQQTKKSRSDKPAPPKRRKREESSILWHFESMDRINLAMQGTNDLEQVMKDVLDTLLSVFECDRAFLVYPCDPEAATWQVPMERVRPEYPGALPVGIEMPLTADGAEVFRSLRATTGPVQFGPGQEHEVDPGTRETFNIQSYIAMALYPKIGKPWSFGLHQCSYARTWTAEEERLLQEIGGRLSDTLTSLLAYRNLQKSEQQVKQLIEASPVAMIVASGIEERVEWMNGKFTELFGYTIEDVPDVEHWWPLAYPDEAYRRKLQAQWTADVEQAIREKGQTRPIEAIVRCKDGSRRFIEFRFSSIGEKHLVTFVDLTERRNAEEKLRTSERNYREIFENVSDALFLLEVTEDGHFRNMEVNRAFEISTGFSRDQLLGKIIEDVVPQETAEAVNAKYRHCLEAGTLIEEEVELQLPTGLQTYHSSLIPVRDDNGRIYRIIGITRDITESRRMQEALRASEEELRSLINTMTDVIFVGNAEGRFLKIMDTNPPLLYKPSQELLGRTLHEVFPKDMADLFLNHLRRALSTRQSVNFEYSLPIGGQEMWFYATVSPMTDDKTLMVARDITDLKKAQAQLLASEQLFRALAENSPDNVARYDVNCRTIYVNPTLEKTLGRPASEMLGTTPAEARFLAESEDFHDRIVGVLQTGINDEMDLVLPDIGDGVRYHNIRFVAERGADGTITGVQAIGRDMTERKRADMALSRERELLRTLVDNLPEEVYVKDRERRFLFVNELLVRALGARSMDDVIGKRDEDFWPPYLAKQFADEENELMRTGKPLLNDEHSPPPKSGKKRWLLRTKVPLRDGAGNIIGLAGLGSDITERKQAEQAVRESEERLLQIASSLREAVWLRDVQTRQVLYVNPAFQEITGRTCESFYENRNAMMEAIHPDDRAWVIEALAQRLDIPFDREHRIVHLDGSVRWVSSRISPVRNESGEVYRWASTLVDITERKQAEAALRDSERRLIEAQRIAHVGYWERNVEAGYIILSDEACRIFGLSPQDVPFSLEQWHQRWLELIHPEDRSRTSKVAADALAGASAYNVEYRIIRPGGEVRFIHSEASVSRDESGRPLSMLGMMQDITDRKQAEDELRQNRESTLQFSARLTALLEVTNELSKAESSATLCRQAVQWGRSRLGFDRISIWFIEEHLGIMRGSFGTDEHGELRDEQNSQVEFRHEGLAWLLFSHRDQVALIEHRPLFDHLAHEVGMGDNAMAALWDGGKVIGVISVDNLLTGRPISEHALEVLRLYASTLGHLITRKRAEEDIRRLNQELEQRVAARTAQLAEANDELESFAYSVSHDLRAPLRHVDGFIELLQKRIQAGLDEKSQHYMEMITDSARMMGILIDDLLSFSRMSRAEMVRLPVDLNELVQDVVQQFTLETQDRKVEWKIGPLPQTAGDRAMLRIALVNLISNSLKFTRVRETARIEIECVQASGTEIILFVRDNGVGFDRNYADNLFGVFQRLHHSDEFEGTGIGLATVRRIINRHGGRVWAEAQVDQGATFYFSIPRSTQEKP